MDPRILALRDTVLGVVDVYNISVWPVQVFAAAAALAALVFVFAKPGALADAIVKIVFDLLWLYVGAIFFVGYLVPRLKWGWVGAGLFGLQGTFLIIDALYGGLEFRPAAPKPALVLALACFAIAAVYPLLGWVLGRGWPYAALPASAPGPTALLTLGLLLLARGPRRWLFAIIPAAWAIVVSTGLAVAFHFYEDYALAAAAIVAVTYMALFSYKTSKACPRPV